MLLLKRCLESEQQTQAGTHSALALCSYVEHFESRLEEDLGWGCGWRNIQMMSSHLLEKDDETRDALFGGAGFVPDISALQQWLQIAWAKGFDTQGAQHFNWKIAGTHKWIGTTECAALLRSFGLRAPIVDFQAVGNKRDRETLFATGAAAAICGKKFWTWRRRSSNSAWERLSVVLLWKTQRVIALVVASTSCKDAHAFANRAAAAAASGRRRTCVRLAWSSWVKAPKK